MMANSANAGSEKSRGRISKKKKRQSSSRSQANYEGSGDDPEAELVVVTVPTKSPSAPLQGSARIIKDHCADWHNYIDKWIGLNEKGLAVVKQIVTAKLQAHESSEVATMTEKATNVETDSHVATATHMPEGLDDLCVELTSIYISMEKLVHKMAAITKHLQGVSEMERNFSESGGEQPFFQTWPVHLFWETSSRLGNMYAKELSLKKAIVEDVAHTSSRDVLMTYTSAWLHQPYIDDEATVILESMLRETGHR
ncbi:cyclin-dependent kinase 2-interacting protein-like [Acanthaster planci]|uniref:Cyclin-dependent kinase 2-interacting protein-like n=1 Tax=Acanthaster planci TaxID=133434 RepID=A0A8B7YG17_ACAPL|nr:cyclin-dependent kinase 2-interacting protein-like [Acanthaster planci]